MNFMLTRSEWGLVVVATAAMIVTGCGSDSTVQSTADITQQVEFLNLRVEEISSGRAVARFTTSLPTTCEVEYGLASSDLNLVAQDPTMGPVEYSLDHDVPLEGLVADTPYFWRARGTTEDAMTFFSDTLSFRTEASSTTMDAALVNVAHLDQGTIVMSVSSNFGGARNDQTWGASKAVDGEMSSEWATNGDGDAASLTLDLGSDRSLSSFGFRSRRMPDGSSIITRVRLVINEGAVEGATIIGPFDTPDPDVLYRFDLEPPVSTRVITIEAVTTTGGNTGAREIQLFSTDG